MSWRNVCASCAVGFVLVFGASATAVAKRAPIAGKLSEPGYTVIALAPP